MVIPLKTVQTRKRSILFANPVNKQALSAVLKNLQQTLKIATLSLLLWFVPQAQAELTIEISDSYENALPIAIVPFAYESNSLMPTDPATQQTQAPVDIAAIVKADLRRSGRFKPLNPASFPMLLSEPEQIEYSDWKALDIDNMLIGKVVAEGNGLYQIDMRFMDVLRKNQVIGKRWRNIPATSLRQVAHQISDLIYEELTGVRGAFNTQIAYVTVKKVAGKRQFTLEISDADGHNPQPILRSRQPIMSPSWSPDGSKLAYVSFESGRSNIIVQSLDGRYRKVIADYKGINGAPAWSPDGSKIALTLSKDGSADIYILDLATQRLQRVTRHWSIETEAAWAPNGRSLYFNSDRRGQPQVFQVFLDTMEVSRITFEGKYNANPEISPDGRYLAVVNGNGGFHISLQDLYSNEFTKLTDTYLDESPSFAPNGEMILYAMNKNGKGELAVVAIDGKTSQTLKVKDGEVREPAWGPFLTR
ncbi:Tol-Pal system beta propeller repeat protein TolB [Thiomicrorhabdus sediminis]|uniref:Tol-Pal system protein TolB n=1 Tax=Thiomicrorhabdus sediminis TaxID=2580412 RepID=A0A4P9K9K2_9GAMM|nr:Tol-Pal system beta propeller repeat protein TolB [Thiomicrorhabdus sediminis]